MVRDVSGPPKPEELDPKLISPLFDILPPFRFLPERWRKPLRFGVIHEGVCIFVSLSFIYTTARIPRISYGQRWALDSLTQQLRFSLFSHTQARTRTRARAETHTRTNTHTQIHARTHAHTHTHARTHARTHAHTHTHARTTERQARTMHSYS